MLTGSAKREQQANSQNSKANTALAPKSYSDPYGSFNGKSGQFSPTTSATQNQAMTGTQGNINSYTQNLSQPFDMNSYYNNPFNKNATDLLNNQTNRQFGQDKTALSNQLNAQNQTGSSFDALSNSYLNQNHDYNLNQNALQGMQAGSNAYNQVYQNNINGLNTANQSAAAQQQFQYQPLNAALSYQNAMNPLQQGQANTANQAAQYYYGKKTGFDNYMAMQAQGAQAAGQIAKSGA